MVSGLIDFLGENFIESDTQKIFLRAHDQPLWHFIVVAGEERGSRNIEYAWGLFTSHVTKHHAPDLAPKECIGCPT